MIYRLVLKEPSVCPIDKNYFSSLARTLSSRIRTLEVQNHALLPSELETSHRITYDQMPIDLEILRISGRGSEIDSLRTPIAIVS